ncbi:glycosyltransferase family 2 protein [Streptococcus sp.]|nr:glycosyltransferase family 2 protein [Streptococcus sp.]MDY3824714.1 glycosyltransferase family A protein [Streptococcus sp.]
MNQPLISVVIPNFNRGHLIEEVIRSITSQTYHNIEIIVVDDHSTDGSMNTLERLKSQLSNLTYLQLPKNQGANVCRNTGVKLAKGNYIAFLDSDDYFLPTKLEKQIQIFNQFPEIGFVVTGFGAKTFTTLGEGIIPIKDTIKQNNLGGFSTLMVKKDIFLAVGGLDEQLLSCQDWDLFLKLLNISQGYKIAEDLVIYETQEDSISRNSTKVIQGYQIVSKRAKTLNHQLNLIPQKELEAYQDYYLAMRYFGLKDIKHTRTYLKQSIKRSPKLVPIVYFIFASFGYSSLRQLMKCKAMLRNVKTLVKRS